ncbi:MAG: phosphate ABC transporter permease subunit PstC [Alphaproteobacteria bacterium]
MSSTVIFATLAVLALAGYWLGRGRATALAGGRPAALNSLPSYHGYFVALWAGVPAVVLFLLWLLFGSTIIDSLVMSSLPESATAGKTGPELNLLLANIQNTAAGVGFVSDDPAIVDAAAYYNELGATLGWTIAAVVLVLALAGLSFAYQRLGTAFLARKRVERAIRVAMILCAGIAVLTTLGILLSMFFESLRFFERYSPIDFLFGLTWSPQTAIREDQVGSSGAFGAVPVFAGTLLISAVAMLIAVPVGLMSAIFLSEYASDRLRATVKPVLEILAGVPTVVYGFFAILTVAPLFRDLGDLVGLPIAANSAAAAGVVMGVMIIPFVSSLSDDVMRAVPRAMRDGAAALGATRSEMIRQVVLPAALPGIVGAILLAVSRAIGETMIVVMAAGLAANLTANPFEAVTTVTVQIVANLTGDTAFDSAKTLSAFALGLVLFVVTLFLNVVALAIVKKYREKYD